MAGWVYPNGTSQPSAAGAVPVKIVCGWPNSADLQEHLTAAVAYISIYPIPGAERLTTRYPREWQTITGPAPTITFTQVGEAITLAGTVSSPQLVAVAAYGKIYVRAVQPSDTLATIASALATLISADGQAVSSGSVLTVPSPQLGARVGGFASVARELRRQERLFQITVWTSSPEQRDIVAGFVDLKFAGAGDPNGLEFIALPDGFVARIQYARTLQTDKDELSGSFRRDLIYSIEYATTETVSAPQIVGFEVQATANGAPAIDTVTTDTIEDVVIELGGGLDFSQAPNSDLIPEL